MTSITRHGRPFGASPSLSVTGKRNRTTSPWAIASRQSAADANPEQVTEMLRRANRSPIGKTKALNALGRIWTGLKSKAQVSADAKLVRERDEVRKAETTLARERDALRGAQAEFSREVEELSLAWSALSRVIKVRPETARDSIASLLP
ncbi:MAG: hypothetical protein ACRCTI_06415, partial [Beijerinckiaceae bacterium]